MDDSKKECRTPRQPNNLQESIPEVASGVKCEADPPDNIPEAIQTVFIKCEVPESDPEPTSDTESPEFGAQNVNRGTGPSSCEGSALLEQPQAGSAEAAGISTEVERSDQRAGSLEVKSDSDEKVAPRNISNAPLNEGPAVSTKRTRGSKEPLNCSYCSRSFQLKTLLSRHLRTHTEEKRFRCSQCPAAFAEKSRLHQHTLIHTNEKPFRCRHCPASFALVSYLNQHMLTHTGEKPYECSQCTASFTRKRGLQVHMLTHSVEKPFRCSHCPSSFATKDRLVMHLRTHTGEKPFSCSQCSASFAQKGTLETHMLGHTGERPFSCGQCSLSFIHKYQLKEHMRNMHCECILAENHNSFEFNLLPSGTMPLRFRSMPHSPVGFPSVSPSFPVAPVESDSQLQARTEFAVQVPQNDIKNAFNSMFLHYIQQSI
ncbi:unnamed protein product [Bemisia tabaci]|uniref:C2H2-type domain-containing protein n=1 Tax=Bemisia tabaci TaxID=7038 RepID=A0A9P0AMU7_BEMTA|nr:unnamed protein product [Bemisia tabaci]